MVRRSLTSAVLYSYACSFSFPFDPSEQKQKDIFLPSLVAFPGMEALELILLGPSHTQPARYCEGLVAPLLVPGVPVSWG